MVELLNVPLTFRLNTVAKRVGLLMLSTDHTAELEFSRLITEEDIGIYTTRVQFANPTTPQNLRAMVPFISEAAQLLLPGSDFDVIYYGCTSASVVIGDEVIVEGIHRAKPTAEVITPTIAALKAFDALGVHKVALLTPYLAHTSAPMQPYFEKSGLKIVKHSCLGMEDDREMARLDAQCLVNAALEADDQNAECLFISCTALRSIEVAGEIEKRINKPVVTSNQAAIWLCRALLGMNQPKLDACRLFATPYNLSVTRTGAEIMPNRAILKTMMT